MSHYTHFTTEEREVSRVMLEEGFSFRAIARKLNRAPSSVSREIGRNRNKNGTYTAHGADRKYRSRRKNCGRKPVLLNDPEKQQYVFSRLSIGWSPEEIVGRSRLEQDGFSLSTTTIYRAIHAGVLPKTWRAYCRILCRKNRKKKPNDARGKIPNAVSIRERPEAANDRSEFGHWESDTVLGKRNTGCFGTHVERKSGFLIAFKIPDRKDDVFNKKTVALFEGVPAWLKRSFTVDHGKEFLSHEDLSQKTGMSVYFCDPYSPWQRGSNENTNGLLRQYFPKGSSFEDISDERLAYIVDLINNRPRKRFNYLTPTEVLSNAFCCT